MTISTRTFLGVARLLVGAVSLVAPDTSGRIFGLGSESTAWIARLFGSREVALAVALLAAPPNLVFQVAALGAGVDTLDAVSSVAELGRGRISTYTFISGGCGALLFAVLGLVAARGARPAP